MAARRRTTDVDPEPSPAPPEEGEAEPVVRRSPFSDNPEVGARGQRTQQRILDAALQVFGDDGYHRCTVDRITAVAGCSRGSFYQYFSSKEEVFRQLTGRVARQLAASAEALDPITPDAAGWASLRAWVGRHADIQRRYDPVFRAFPAAAASDVELLGGSARTTDRDVARIRSRVAATDLPPRRLDAVIRLLVATATMTQSIAIVLRAAAPDDHPDGRVHDALADVMHRSFFGALPGVNVRPAPARRPTPLRFGPLMQEALLDDEVPAGLNQAGRRTRAALLSAGRDEFVRRGFHGTRVDDIVESAGVSHGAFYRYFENKEGLALVVMVQAMRTVATTLAEIPDPDLATTTALRRWLRTYNAAHVAETAMIRVWVDAAIDDEVLDREAAAAYDWGRRRMVRFLSPRAIGDTETDAIILLALVDAFGSREQPPEAVDAAAHIVERGLLGR